MAINILRRKIQTPVNTNIKGTGTEKYGDVSGLSREERLELIYQKRPDLRPKTGVFEIPITKEVKERVLAKPFTPTEQSIFTGTIPELVVQGFRKELEKGRIYDWFIKTQPERYKKLSIQPEIFTQQGRNKLVSKGLITSEESEIFSAIPEYTPVITGMKEVGVKDFIKMVQNAGKYKTADDFAKALAKRFGTTVEKFNAGIKTNFGMPSAQKLWQYATGKTTSLTIPKAVKPIFPKKPPVPFTKPPTVTPVPKVPVKPTIPATPIPAPPVSPTKLPSKAITPEKGIITPISKELEPLVVEARKYKSAEEFVKENMVKGTPTRNIASEANKIIYVNDIPIKMEVSKLFPTETAGTKKLMGLEDTFTDIKAGKKITEPIIVSEKGTIYDGHNRYFQAVANGDKTIDVYIKKPNDVIKSQLTNIYNQAVKEVKPTEIIPVEPSKEVGEYTNFIYKDDPLKTISKKIQVINGLRLSGKITTQEANKEVSKAKTELIKIAKERDIALLKTAGKKSRPAIRESGFYADKAIENTEVRDVYNATMPPHLMALKQDMSKLGEKFGTIFSKMWKPTEVAIKMEKSFLSANTKLVKQLGNKYKITATKQNLERLSDVVEGKIKATPNEEKYIEELRVFLDNLREQANVVREAMGKKKIGYIENYIPHIQKASLWNELLSNKATISDNLDFIVPNQVKNPFAFKRMMEELPKAERNLYILLDKYIRAISKDIYITPAIENIKVYNNVLKNREIVDASRYWDEYIRVGLIGKQHKLDSALSISYQVRKGLQKWNGMVNLAFLTGKLSWNLATQPLSYIMNVPMEAGILNSVKAIRKSFNKPLRQFVKDNSNVLAIKSSDVKAVAIGEGRNIQNRIYKTKIDKWNDMISMLGAVEERELTLASYIAGLDRAKDLGYTGKDALWFADLTAARTQSMYNKENRALILDSDITRTLFPFNSFSVEMFNHIKEIGTKASGAMKSTYRQRAGKLFRLLIGLYLANLYSKTLTGNKKTTIGTFVPFFGAWVDAAIAKAQGRQYYGGRSPITVVQILNDSIKGARDFISHGDTKKLRKIGVNFGLALGGIGGGGQINNIIDGIMADINEEVRNIEGDVMFETKDALSKVIAPIFGVWATIEGREYWSPKEEDGFSTGRGLEFKSRQSVKQPTRTGIEIKRR